MDASQNGVRRRSLSSGLRWAFATRSVRFPILLLTGAGIALLLTLYVQANYIDLCERYALFPSNCGPVSLRTAYATALAIAGLLMLVFGPVVNGLYHLVRYGQPWETSRVETAVSNFPLLAGVLYLAAAAVLAFA